MWESRGADEPITTNFRSLVFYEERLLLRVYEEVEAFLATPAEALLAASGAPAEARFKPLKANNTSRPKRDAQGRAVHPPWDPTPLGVAARELSF